MSEISNLVNKAVKCVEESPTLNLNLDSLTRLLIHHKLVTLFGTAQKIPPEIRQHFYIYTLPEIGPVIPFTALTDECIETLKTLAALALTLSLRTEHPRAKVVLARIGAIISRSLTKNGINGLTKRNLIGILHELEINIVTATTQIATEVP
jgi:hypothetical protein